MRRLLLVTALASSAFLLSGCAAPAPSVLPQDAAPGQIRDNSMSGGASTENILDQGAKSDVPGAPVPGQQIITTVTVTIVVDSPVTSADQAAVIATQYGGVVADRNETQPNARQGGSAQLTLRIPSDKLDSALEQLKQLGDVKQTAINSTDVTSQSQDLDARITALKASVDRLLELLSKATDTTDLITIESALSQRQADLESMESQKRYLDDQVQLSTVMVNLYAELDTPPDAPVNFWTGVVAGWNGLVGFVKVALVVIGVLLPWLIALGVIAVITIAWVKLALRRSRNKKAKSTTTT
ncbi:MAG: DUF4349 domain-containing protein [Microbacteriaceae bacterium]|nr:DUF4349 domain-containing protein [Cryobacterium sp.]MBX3103961.1 DUF4349 domain-containing protein [Cryobacterium sp.]MCC6376880.1 DUF4349 domain-containing protein [Microbacteriaceae bacterium]